MTRLRNVVGVLALSLCLVSRVMAAVATAPWEAAFFWYAYRMDIEAYGKRNDMIAPLCSGSASGGTCNFDEFFAHIQKASDPLDPNQKTSIGDNLWPDAQTAADELGKLTQKGGNSYSAQYDRSKLFQIGKFSTNEGIASLLKEATSRMQAARTQLGDDSDKIKTGLAQAKVALEKAHQIRLESTARGDELVNALEEFKEKSLSFKVEYDDFTSPDNWSGKLINMGKMAAQPDWDKNWKDYQVWIDSKKGKQFKYLVQARLHKNALVAIQDQSARLHGPSSC